MSLTETKPGAACGRRFDFNSDSFAFANELLWEYRFDPSTGRTIFSRREPPPAYAHRCFVLVRAARQFLYHAYFDAGQAAVREADYRALIRRIMARNPRTPCAPERRILIPGYASLRAFSAARAGLLQAACGGAWQSYVLRSHWRMVFPISRAHQRRTAAALVAALAQNQAPIVHLVRFPELTINHGMILFAVASHPGGFKFSAYDPNDPSAPAELAFDRQTGGFSLPPNAYWAGGELKVIEIFRNWLM